MIDEIQQTCIESRRKNTFLLSAGTILVFAGLIMLFTSLFNSVNSLFFRIGGVVICLAGSIGCTVGVCRLIDNQDDEELIEEDQEGEILQRLVPPPTSQAVRLRLERSNVSVGSNSSTGSEDPVGPTGNTSPTSKSN